MNALVPQNFGPISTRFQGAAMEDDLSAGVQTGFGIIGYKGKVWSIRKSGAETPLMREDGDGPRNSIEVVLLKASAHVSKIWYKDGYVEGSTAAPDCFSTNGVTPDAGSKNKQANACALCPMNQWGSRITPAGKQGKACSDSKRVAVAPLGDIKNEAFGGPMLLRVPAASLKDLAAYGQKMQALGYQYYAIGTRIAFDPAEAYPKFTFGAIRPLSDAEADLVLELRGSHQVTTILAEGSENAAQPVSQAAQIASAFEQPPVQPVAAPAIQAPQPAPAPAPAPVQAAPAPAPAPQPVVAAPTTAPATTAPAAQSSFEDSLDAQLDQLLG
ncbi:hypothetical protein CWO91_16885 [Bradyrhizobium genosp. SA-3]|uniref:hypothetical protein n=1 Tax=Bradyrhizobium genosp. SA-3 TaxID=508868 RepID=UPI0010288344|nr:hypothetical protein [Bradyrhizobium genosp. SA-3]RZN09704.1 hypothetical protein CWO91_16885 [Bradyrhizobium genosp. SA-3]